MEHLSEALLPVLERLDRIESSMDKNQTPKLMTIKDLVQYSRLSEATIRRHIMRGSLKPFKKDGKKLFRKVNVDRWLNG
tara:strand:- start:94 stop:330 length:237 start_codon:yes stop_codon:yes gene_type:complete